MWSVWGDGLLRGGWLMTAGGAIGLCRKMDRVGCHDAVARVSCGMSCDCKIDGITAAALRYIFPQQA